MVMLEAVDPARVGWWVYVLRCADDTFYSGVSSQLARRLAAHKEGRGAWWTREHGAVALVAARPCSSFSEARSLEAIVKRLGRKEKRRIGRLEGWMTGRDLAGYLGREFASSTVVNNEDLAHLPG
jgi:putative endonuclease